MMNDKPIIENSSQVVAILDKVSKDYKAGGTTITALKETSYEFQTHKLTLILGPSGSGKTTLLSILGSVIYPTTGKVIIKDKPTEKLNQKQLAGLRLNNIGFVFQYFNLISPLNVLENVMQPLLLMGKKRKEAEAIAHQALDRLNMTDRLKSLPKMLSGGQQQRVAIARALVTDPSIVLCDEPTASLDHDSVKSVMERLKNLSRENRAVIVVTHDQRLMPFADEIIYMQNGEISDVPKEPEL